MKFLIKMTNVEYDYAIGDELSDARIFVDNHCLLVHKAILAQSSPVFRRLFTSGLKESVLNEVNLPGKTYEEVTMLLDFIYPNKIYDLNKNDMKIQRLLELSDEYDISSIKLKVEKYFIDKLRQTSSKLYGNQIERKLDYGLYLIELSREYQLKRLQAEVIEFLAKTFDRETMERNEDYKNLSSDVKLEITRKKLINFEEMIKIKDKKIKKLQDENLINKFELKKFINE